MRQRKWKLHFFAQKSLCSLQRSRKLDYIRNLITLWTFFKILLKIWKNHCPTVVHADLKSRNASKSLFIQITFKLSKFLPFWQSHQKPFTSTGKKSWFSNILNLNYILGKLISVLSNKKEITLMTLYYLHLWVSFTYYVAQNFIHELF